MSRPQITRGQIANKSKLVPAARADAGGAAKRGKKEELSKIDVEAGEGIGGSRDQDREGKLASLTNRSE